MLFVVISLVIVLVILIVIAVLFRRDAVNGDYDYE